MKIKVPLKTRIRTSDGRNSYEVRALWKTSLPRFGYIAAFSEDGSRHLRLSARFLTEARLFDAMNHGFELAAEPGEAQQVAQALIESGLAEIIPDRVAPAEGNRLTSV